MVKQTMHTTCENTEEEWMEAAEVNAQERSEIETRVPSSKAKQNKQKTESEKQKSANQPEELNKIGSNI